MDDPAAAGAVGIVSVFSNVIGVIFGAILFGAALLAGLDGIARADFACVLGFFIIIIMLVVVVLRVRADGLCIW